jgi:hypothetical protein
MFKLKLAMARVEIEDIRLRCVWCSTGFSLCPSRTAKSHCLVGAVRERPVES